MRFVLCQGAIFRTNGRAVATYEPSASEEHVQKTAKSACGRKGKHQKLVLCRFYRYTHAIRCFYWGWDSKSSHGCIARCGHFQSQTAEVEGGIFSWAGYLLMALNWYYEWYLVKVILTIMVMKHTLWLLTVNSSLLLIPSHSTACRFRRILNVLFGGR